MAIRERRVGESPMWVRDLEMSCLGESEILDPPFYPFYFLPLLSPTDTLLYFEGCCLPRLNKFVSAGDSKVDDWGAQTDPAVLCSSRSSAATSIPLSLDQHIQPLAVAGIWRAESTPETNTITPLSILT